MAGKCALCGASYKGTMVKHKAGWLHQRASKVLKKTRSGTIVKR